jgi:drug/metabolite transporter (DMT)-like permease
MAAVYALLVIIWGTTWSVIQVGLRGIPPFGGVALRFFIAGFTLWLIARLRGIPLGRKKYEKALWCSNALFAFCISYGVVYWAEQWIPSGLAAVLFATYPLFIGVIAHFGLKNERIGMTEALGMIIGFAGVAVIFSTDVGAIGGRQVWIASIVMLLSPFAAAISTAGVKRWGAGIHPLSLTAMPMMMTGVAMGVIALVFETDRSYEWSREAIAALLYLAIFGSAVTFTFYYWLLALLPAKQMALVAYLIPVIAISIGIWTGETMTPRMWFGSAMVIGGVALVIHLQGRARRLDRARRAAIVVLISCGLISCGTEEATVKSEPRKVAIIGWDGATWDVIDPLLRAGRLPNLQRLLDQGSRGTLVAEPPLLSPVVWTTIATGFPRSQHGILDFQMPDPGSDQLMLASTMHRRKAPLWRMASSQKRQVGFVGWWTTWPAEPVFGWMISDHLAYNRWGEWARRPQGEHYQLTSPPTLVDQLKEQAVRPETIPIETLTAIAPFSVEEQRQLLAADKPVKFHAPSVFKFAYSTDASNAAFSRYMLDNVGQPDLFGTLFVLSDVAGHVFWHHYQPQLYPPQADSGRLREAIPNVYIQLDRWTGEILDRLEPGTITLLVSDHGMGAVGQLPRPGVNPAGDHHPNGIFVASGDGVIRGGDLGSLRQIDFAPTVLALMGLPVAADMPGRARLDGLPASTPSVIESYGEGLVEWLGEGAPPTSKEYEERLRSLGYVN